jgi:hypothetical protein
MWSYGGEWTGYEEWIEFLRIVCDYEKDGRVDYSKWGHWLNATLHGGIRIMHKEFCIISDRPEFIKTETVNGRGRLHCESGPAKKYRDGWGIYSVHGVRVPADVIERPDLITVQRIQDEPNAEVRRIMIGKFGYARYLKEAGANLKMQDECGKLWSIDRKDDTPLVMVEVLNSSPEPINYEPQEGESYERIGNRIHKIYTLRVPPTMKTAREAVAWTFEEQPDSYKPLIET